MEEEKIENNDDFVIEESENDSQDIVKKLKAQLKECLAEKQEYLTGWQRAKADFVNYKREEEEKRESFAKFCEKNLILDILQIADSFDRLFENRELLEKADKDWQKGIENLRAQLMKILKSRDVEALESVGKEFNPQEHEALGQIEIDSKEKSDIVLEELRKGYKMRGIIIRPSQVKVGKFIKK